MVLNGRQQTNNSASACEDLFDSVVQSIFGVGLQLERVLEATEDSTMRLRLDDSIAGLHRIISSVRDRGDLRCEPPCPCSRQQA